MVEAGGKTIGRPRQYAARGRPNWWVILAVSMALMALLAATSAGSHGSGPLHPQTQASDTSRVGAGRTARHNSAPRGTAPTTVPSSALRPPTTTTTPLPTATLPRPAGSLVAASTTTIPPATTTVPTTVTAASDQSTPSDRTTDQGNLQPPEDASTGFSFQGAGAEEVSVSWGNDVYLSLAVTCPNASQSAGGSSAMAVSLPDAQGTCEATVSEPSSEDTALSFTITIGPSGG